MAYDGPATVKSEDDWRARNDHDTLMRACEVMADKIRMRGVMREHTRQARAERKMGSLLAKFKTGKAGHY